MYIHTLYINLWIHIIIYICTYHLYLCVICKVLEKQTLNFSRVFHWGFLRIVPYFEILIMSIYLMWRLKTNEVTTIRRKILKGKNERYVAAGKFKNLSDLRQRWFCIPLFFCFCFFYELAKHHCSSSPLTYSCRISWLLHSSLPQDNFSSLQFFYPPRLLWLLYYCYQSSSSSFFFNSAKLILIAHCKYHLLTWQQRLPSSCLKKRT